MGEGGGGLLPKASIVAVLRHLNSFVLKLRRCLTTRAPSTCCTCHSVAILFVLDLVQVFDHNNPDHLEAVLRTNIAEGQPRTGRPWKKVGVGMCGWVGGGVQVPALVLG